MGNINKCSKDLIKFLTITFCVFFSSCSKDDFQWNLKKAPEISQISLINNDLNKLDISANCLSDGNDEKLETGFCWAIYENPTIDNNRMPNSQKSKGQFNCIYNWSNTSKIHIRAYAKNSVTTVYSNDLEVSWPGSTSNKPIIQTLSVTNLSFYAFQASGNITSDGGLNVYSKGVCISTQPNPSLSNSSQIKYFTGTDNQFFLDFNGLQDNTTYYLSAFATNIAGTSYGNIVSAKTPKHYNIGDVGPAGGYIIFQNTENNSSWNSLEVAPSDISGNYPWSPNLTQSNVTGVNLADGYNNTLDLINFYGSTTNYAAEVAYNWTNSGSTEWFLPSLYELKLIKELLFDPGIGNLSNNSTYWSSSEDLNYSQNAWSIKMSTSNTNQIVTQQKNNSFKVRAIRRI